MIDREEALKKIHDELMELRSSPLYSYRVENNYLPVPGEGSVEAKIMLVGEAPGENEAKTGQPFCGRAGKILDALLSDVGLKREDIFITSIVKDRPPKNRDPRPEEIEMYAPFLDRQIEVIRPEIVATLGRFSMEYIMNRYGLEDKIAPISILHGQELQAASFKLIPLYHPAAAIYNQKLMVNLKEDFQLLAKR